jgi:hypothetical protein
VKVTNSPPSVSTLPRKCGNLDVLQPYGPSRPVIGIALPFYIKSRPIGFVDLLYRLQYMLKSQGGIQALVLGNAVQDVCVNNNSCSLIRNIAYCGQNY